MFHLTLALFLGLATALPVAAQSTAINGSIEGVVTDDSGAMLPGVTVTLDNLDTGDSRVVITNENGLYRAPLLPLGRYRVSAPGADAAGCVAQQLFKADMARARLKALGAVEVTTGETLLV